jgi:hypothetical protein
VTPGIVTARRAAVQCWGAGASPATRGVPGAPPCRRGTGEGEGTSRRIRWVPCVPASCCKGKARCSSARHSAGRWGTSAARPGKLLYPNEENVFLDRLRDHGRKVRYEPAAVVTRPAPAAGLGLARKVFAYGRGRAAQARRRLTAASAARLAAACGALLAPLSALAALRWSALPLVALGVLGILYYGLIALRIARREGLRLGISVPGAALVTQLAYAAGVLFGLCRRLPARGGALSIEKRSLAG